MNFIFLMQRFITKKKPQKQESKNRLIGRFRVEFFSIYHLVKEVHLFPDTDCLIDLLSAFSSCT